MVASLLYHWTHTSLAHPHWSWHTLSFRERQKQIPERQQLIPISSTYAEPCERAKKNHQTNCGKKWKEKTEWTKTRKCVFTWSWHVSMVPRPNHTCLSLRQGIYIYPRQTERKQKYRVILDQKKAQGWSIQNIGSGITNLWKGEWGSNKTDYQQWKKRKSN